MKKATMHDCVAALFGWDEADQRRRFEATFDPSAMRIVRVDGQDSGLIEVLDKGDYIFLSRIELLPRVQRRGVGSRLIADVLDDARARKLSVRLQVLTTNPAIRLYERMGFSEYERSSSHIRMIWDPGKSSDPAPSTRASGAEH